MTLTFRRNSERLMSDVANANFHVRLDDLSLVVEYLKLQETTLLNLRNRLSRGPLFYPYLSVALAISSRE